MIHRGNNTGFTLIEILVALTIIAAILAMVYGSFAATTHAIDASGERTARMEQAGFALRLMSHQIRGAYVPNEPSPGSTPGGIQPATDAGGSSPHRRPALFHGDSRDPGGEILSFITGSGLGAGPNASRGLSRVTYRYDRSSSTLSISREDQTDSTEPHSQAKRSNPLMNNVTAVELKFHDGRQWRQVWDASGNRELPRAVKVEIVVTDEAGRSHRLGTTIPVVQDAHPESGNVKRAVAAGQP